MRQNIDREEDHGERGLRGKSSRLGKAFAALAWITFALAVTELAFGSWLGTNYGVLNIPRDTNRKFDVTGLYRESGVAEFRIDHHGFRGDYGGDPAGIDLLVIGNGTTLEPYVTEGRTWVDYLRQCLATTNDRPNIAAAGMNGQTTAGLIHRFDVWHPLVPGLEPGYVLAYIGSNEGDMKTQRPSDLMISPQISRRIRQYILNNSIVYRLFRKVRADLRANQATRVNVGTGREPGIWVAVASPPDIGTAGPEWMEIRSGYAKRIEKLIERIRSSGAQPIIVNQHGGDYRIVDGVVMGRLLADGTVTTGSYGTMTTLGAIAMEACRRGNGICVDLVSELGVADGDYYDDIHTTPQGDARIGRFVCSKVGDLIHLDPAAGDGVPPRSPRNQE